MNLLIGLLQSASPATQVQEWGALGVGGLLALVMFHFYRQDRLGSEKRYAELAADFRAIITLNTEASTALRDAIHTVANCPFQGQSHCANRVHDPAQGGI